MEGFPRFESTYKELKHAVSEVEQWKPSVLSLPIRN